MFCGYVFDVPKESHRRYIRLVGSMSGDDKPSVLLRSVYTAQRGSWGTSFSPMHVNGANVNGATSLDLSLHHD